MRIRREIKLYIEAELKDYNDTIRQIGIDKNELILAGSMMDDSGIRGTDTSNPTQSKAFKLLTNRRIRRMEDTVKAIAKVVDALPEDKYKMIELRYWKRPRTLTDVGMAMELNCSRATLYNWIDGVVLAIGKEMGIVD